jgi:CDP-diacylglycerol--glycerol-3-phosphate 3-phosphatidyltransferase
MRNKLTISDKILEKVFLPIVPKAVTPNMITWMRFASVPFVGYFFWIGSYTIALPLFIFAAFTDAVDGALARTRGPITDLGKIIDPLADKLLIATAALILIPRYLDWSIVLIMVGIDLILIVNGYLKKRYYGIIIQAENAGKIKMVLQSLGLITLLIYTLTLTPALLATSQYLFYGAIFFALTSLVVYRAV